MKRVPKLL